MLEYEYGTDAQGRQIRCPKPEDDNDHDRSTYYETSVTCSRCGHRSWIASADAAVGRFMCDGCVAGKPLPPPQLKSASPVKLSEAEKEGLMVLVVIGVLMLVFGGYFLVIWLQK